MQTDKMDYMLFASGIKSFFSKLHSKNSCVKMSEKTEFRLKIMKFVVNLGKTLFLILRVLTPLGGYPQN